MKKEAKCNLKYLVGIDLGTTNSSCHIGKVEDDSIQNNIHEIKQLVTFENENIISTSKNLPSLVLLNHDTAFTGSALLNNMSVLLNDNTHTLVKDVKSHIGNNNWKCYFEDGSHNAIEVTSIILKTIWDSVKSEIDTKKIFSITITIPAKFTSQMRHNTLRAAIAAGMPIGKLSLLDEPIAAIFSDWNESNNSYNSLYEEDMSLVYDIGGGTVDVSIVKINNEAKNAKILSTSRYNKLGGSDWDLEIATLIVRKLKEDKEYNDYFECADKHILRTRIIKLLILAKDIKERLDQVLKEKGILKKDDKLRGDLLKVLKERTIEGAIEIDFHMLTSITPQTLTLSLYDILVTSSLFLNFHNEDNYVHSFFSPIKQALQASKEQIANEDIDRIFITGGGSQSKLLKNQLGEYLDFGRITPLDSKFAISKGAVYFSYLFSKNLHDKSSNYWTLTETTTEKVFLAVSGKGFTEIFDSNLSIPYQDFETKFEENEETIYLRQIASFDNGEYKLSIFQGLSREDPFIQPFAHVFFKLPNHLDDSDKIKILSTSVSVNQNQIYQLKLVFRDSKGAEGYSETEFDINKSAGKRQKKKTTDFKINSLDLFNQIINH